MEQVGSSTYKGNATYFPLGLLFLFLKCLVIKVTTHGHCRKKSGNMKNLVVLFSCF